MRSLRSARASGLDQTLSATKQNLAHGLLLNATARWTEAIQDGLLGFGDAGHDRSVQFERLAGKLVTPTLMIGAEVRSKPDRLAFAREETAVDLFVAWNLTPALTSTAAYADLGAIATFRDQRGGLLSLQAAF